MRALTYFLLILFTLPMLADGQMKRERANTVKPVTSYTSPVFYGQSTVRQIASRNLNVTIMHSFGIATRNVLQNFFGFDNVRNVRIGLDYGLSDRWSMGIGRSSLLNVMDIRSKYAFFQQNSDDSVPVSMSMEGDFAIVTQENNRPAGDDISWYGGIPLSRKFNDRLSLQLTPGIAYFNSVSADDYNTLCTISVASEIRLSERFSMITEYYPVIGNRNPDTKYAFTLGLNIETGGHVFQLYFSSAYWHLDQYIMAQNRDAFWNGDFRFGFNINRIFGL